MDILALIFAFLFPPLGVLIKEGLGFHLILNIILTLFGWLPGVIHAVVVVLKDMK